MRILEHDGDGVAAGRGRGLLDFSHGVDHLQRVWMDLAEAATLELNHARFDGL
jgi:hypothetical protein